MAGTGVELLFGPMLIGILLSTTLYGVMAVQMFIYFQTFKKDAQWIRYLVLYLFFAETVNVLCVIGIVYEPLIVRWGSPQALVTSPILLPADAISIVAVSTPIQLFTAWRISIITGSVALPLLVSVLSAASLGGGVLVTAFVTIRNQFQEFQSFSAEIIFWLTSSALCDVLIAVILTYSLWTRKTGFTAMDGQINRIIRLTVQTGAITAVAALTALILFLSFPGTTLQFITDFPLSKLYTICLLSTLNARTRGKAEDVEQRLPNALFKETGLTTVQSPTATQKQITFQPNPNFAVHPDVFGQESMDTLVVQARLGDMRSVLPNPRLKNFVKLDPREHVRF
ncbi:hypothetical protein DFH07DRAFT_1059026 [Mycena maculata]|uniref:DUF6534 domain-containing protein n=1 Tax=Mycena maculata TaxID=230809 RepID=A0AAD7JHU3_9AGAR|nr:hypothetical protein DFH07DRAFT_1059026 [Mycena maculata]